MEENNNSETVEEEEIESQVSEENQTPVTEINQSEETDPNLIKKGEEVETETVTETKNEESEEDLMITPEQVKTHTDEIVQENEKIDEKVEEENENKEETQKSEVEQVEQKEDSESEENKEEEIVETKAEVSEPQEPQAEIKIEEKEVVEEEEAETLREQEPKPQIDIKTEEIQIEEEHSEKIKKLVNKVQQVLEQEIVDNLIINKYLNEIKELEGDLQKDEEVESEEDKKLWEELGIAEDANRKAVVQEIKRWSELFATEHDQKINVYFATETVPQEKLGDKESLNIVSENKEECSIYLNLERKDKLDNFCPNLIFWSFAKEITLIDNPKFEKDPHFWNHFYQNLEWIKKNANKDYRKDWELLLKPSTFPSESLEIKEMFNIFFSGSETEIELLDISTAVSQELIDQVWKKISEATIELVSQSGIDNLTEEQLAKSAIKLMIDYDLASDKEYTIQVSYHSESPFRKQLEKLVITTPLELEIETLREVKISPKDFAKLAKQKKGLENSLRDSVSGEEYQEILEKINQIN